MAIPFPKMHIAASVINRIMNAVDEIEPPIIASMQPDPPIVDDPIVDGALLDEAIATPLPGATADPMQQEGLLAESVAGGSPLEGALNASGSF
jgi:hypothetical protein